MTTSKRQPNADGVIKNETLALDALTPHPRNYNAHPEPQLARIRASLARFGQVRSIVVQRGAPGQFLIVAGHGLVEAARQHGLGQLRADVIPADWSDEQVEGYLVADNLTARASDPDEAMLAALLREQQEAGFDLLSLGTDEAELNDLLAKLEPPSLDELADQFGDEPADDTFWPVVRVKVPSEVKDRFDLMMAAAPGTSDHVKFAAILACVDTAALAQVDPSTLAAFAIHDEDDE